MHSHENDISAEKEIQSKGSWIPGTYEHKGRTQGPSGKKIKGKKEIISINDIYKTAFNVVFSSMKRKYGQIRIIKEEQGFSERL